MVIVMSAKGHSLCIFHTEMTKMTQKICNLVKGPVSHSSINISPIKSTSRLKQVSDHDSWREKHLPNQVNG
jgi:hypothetical protein